jgi:hypothetical protein
MKIITLLGGDKLLICTNNMFNVYVVPRRLLHICINSKRAPSVQFRRSDDSADLTIMNLLLLTLLL